MLLRAYGLGMCFPCSSDGKESACNAGDPGLIPRSGRSLEKCMAPTPVFLPETCMDIGTWQDIGYRSPWGCKESDMIERLTHTHMLPRDTLAHDFPDTYVRIS